MWLRRKMSPASIFISHRAEYGRVARDLKEAIQKTSEGRIEVFLSEDIPRGERWRPSIEEHLRDAQSLFLIYGAAYEDWSWCFYEAGYFCRSGSKGVCSTHLLRHAARVRGPGSAQRAADGGQHGGSDRRTDRDLPGK